MRRIDSFNHEIERKETQLHNYTQNFELHVTPEEISEWKGKKQRMNSTLKGHATKAVSGSVINGIESTLDGVLKLLTVSLSCYKW